jgi:hypothetical protein
MRILPNFFCCVVLGILSFPAEIGEAFSGHSVSGFRSTATRDQVTNKCLRPAIAPFKTSLINVVNTQERKRHVSCLSNLAGMSEVVDNVAVILLAGGVGSRMKAGMPKQFLELDGKPMVMHSLELFLKLDGVSSLVIVIAEEYRDMFDDLVATDSRIRYVKAFEPSLALYSTVLYCRKWAKNNISNPEAKKQNCFLPQHKLCFYVQGVFCISPSLTTRAMFYMHVLIVSGTGAKNHIATSAYVFSQIACLSSFFLSRQNRMDLMCSACMPGFPPRLYISLIRQMPAFVFLYTNEHFFGRYAPQCFLRVVYIREKNPILYVSALIAKSKNR